jgi:hypothetical protein
MYTVSGEKLFCKFIGYRKASELQVTRYKRGLRSCESASVLIKREPGNEKQWPFYVKLAPDFLDVKLVICITFTDKPGGSST